MKRSLIALALVLTSPALAQELPSVPSNFDTSLWVGPGQKGTNVDVGGPGQTQGAFRFHCTPSHNAYDDPIVYPGQPGKSHLHTFFGNNEANARSTYETLRTKGGSTCAGGPLNRSSYWIPAMMNGRGKVVMPDYVAIYYKAIPGDAKLPRGLRYVFGYDPAKPSAERRFYWNCDDGDWSVDAHKATIAERAASCPAGKQIGAVLATPDCWDGKNLDSADHRSHMAYSTQWSKQVCPSTHPVRVPQFTIGAWYSHDGPADLAQWYLSSDRMPGMPAHEPGTTFHSDWFGAWDDSILDTWHANCINRKLSCVAGELGDGRQLSYPPPPGIRLVDIPPPPGAVVPPPVGPTPVPTPNPIPVPTPTPTNPTFDLVMNNVEFVRNDVAKTVGTIRTSQPPVFKSLVGGAFWVNGTELVFSSWRDWDGTATGTIVVGSLEKRVSVTVKADPVVVPPPPPPPASKFKAVSYVSGSTRKWRIMEGTTVRVTALTETSAAWLCGTIPSCEVGQ